MRPFFQILAGDVDVTARVAAGNIALTITEAVDRDSDDLSYEIDDDGGLIAVPETGVDVRAIGGYRAGDVRDFGLFTVDEVVLSGFPQKISVNGQAAGANALQKQQRSQSYKRERYPTYGDILKDVAGRNGIKLSVAQEVLKKPVDFEAQQEETDAEFLNRIGRRLGFNITVKNKHLIVTKRGSGKSGGGIALPQIVVRRGVNILDYSVGRRDRSKYARVRATYFDRDGVETKEVERPSSEKGPDYVLRTPFRSKEEAEDEAAAKAEELRSATGTATFTINGTPQARAGTHILVRDVRSLVDGIWQAVSVEHQFSAAGAYTTVLECELPERSEG